MRARLQSALLVAVCLLYISLAAIFAYPTSSVFDDNITSSNASAAANVIYLVNGTNLMYIQGSAQTVWTLAQSVNGTNRIYFSGATDYEIVNATGSTLPFEVECGNRTGVNSTMLYTNDTMFYLRFGANATMAFDSTGYGRNLTILPSNTVWTSGVACGGARTYGVLGVSTQGLNRSFENWMDTTNFTFIAWVKPATNPVGTGTGTQRMQVVALHDSGKEDDIILELSKNATGDISMLIDNTGSFFYCTSAGSIVAYDAGWQQIAATVDHNYGGTSNLLIKLFYNGNVVKSCAWNGTVPIGITGGGALVAKSGDPDYYQYNGSVDEVAVYNVAKSEQFIRLSYQSVTKPLSVLTVGEASSAPTVTLSSPTNTTVTVANQSLNFTVTGNYTELWYSVNGGENVSITGNTTLLLSEGANAITVYANSSGGVGSASVTVTLDTTAPTVTILSPTGSKNAANQSLNVTASEAVDLWWLPWAAYANASGEFALLADAASTQGMAYDPRDGTVWLNDFTHVFHYNLTGANLTGAFSLLADANTANALTVDTRDYTIWLIDLVDDYVYHYNLSNGQNLTGGFKLLADAANAVGISYDPQDSTVWLADNADDYVYHYNLSNGQNLTGGFKLLADAADCARILYDDGTLWLADATDDYLYHYNLSTGGNLTNGFALATGIAGFSVAKDGYNDFWFGDNSRDYVLHYAWRQFFAPNTTLLLSEGANNITVYANDTAGNTGWTSVIVTLDSTAPTVTMTSPQDGVTTNQANQSVNVTVSESVDKWWYIQTRIFSTVENLTDGFKLLAAAADVYGVAFDSRDGTLWLADEIDNYIYHYNLSSGGSLSGGFGLLADAASVYGVGFDSRDGTLWLADYIDDYIYHYNLSNGQNLSGGFKLLADAANVVGMTFDSRDSTVWLVDNVDDYVYHYNLSNGQNLSGGFKLLADVDYGWGAAFDSRDGTLWLADYIDHYIYQYDLSNGQNLTGGFSLLADASSVYGVGFDSRDGTLWLADEIDNYIYHYSVSLSVTTLFTPNTTLLLSEGANNITVYANDSAGNIGSTSVVITLDTTAPYLTLSSPPNVTVTAANQSLNFSVTGNYTNLWYVHNGGTSVAIAGNTTLLLSEGSNNITVYANDSVGNTGMASVFVTLDSTPPAITIQKPLNMTVNVSTQNLNVTASEAVDKWWYNRQTRFNLSDGFMLDTNTQALCFAYDPRDSTVWVLDGVDGYIEHFDLATGQNVSGRFFYGSTYTQGCTIDTSDYTFWVNDFWTNYVSHYNLSNGQNLTGGFALLGDIGRGVGIAYDPRDHTAWILDNTDGDVAHYNLSNGQNISGMFRLADPVALSTMTVDNHTNTLWISKGNLGGQNVVKHYNLSNGQNLTDEIVLLGDATDSGAVIDGIAYDPREHTVWIGSQWSDGYYYSELFHYDVENNRNTTFTPNTTVLLKYGANNITVHANDTAGNTGMASVVVTYNPNASSIPPVTTLARQNFTGTILAGENATGFMEVLVTNIDTVPYYNYSINVSSLVPAGWVLNDSDTFLVNISNGTELRHNLTIRTESPPAAYLAPSASDCLGFTIYSAYCYRDTYVDMGTGRTRHTSTARHMLNVSNSQAKNFDILLLMDLSRFTNWGSRNSGSEAGSANASSQNISITSDDTYVNLTVGTNYSTSSLAPGKYYVDVTYTWDTVAGQSPGGGPGGGGGGPSPQIPSGTKGNVTYSLSPSDVNWALKAGETLIREFMIACTSSTECIVRVSIDQDGTDPSGKWATIRKGNFAYTTQTFNASAGTRLQPGIVTFNVSMQVPQNAEERTYKFFVTASADNGPTIKTPWTVSVGSFCLICSAATLWNAHIDFANPILGFTQFSIGNALTVIAIAVGAIWFIRFLRKPRKRK